MNYAKPPGWPVSQPQQREQQLSEVLEAAKNGAIVGATGAAAASLHQLRQNRIGWQEALANTARVGAAAGLATGAATSVGQVLRKHPLLSLTAALATGTAVMYYLNQEKDQEDQNDEA